MFEDICNRWKVYKKDIDYPFLREMWENQLFLYLMSMFVYDGLPDYLPAREIEFNLLPLGKAAIIKKGNKALVTKASFSGVTAYYDINPTLTWSLLNMTGVRMKYDFVRAKNTDTEMSVAPMVSYYADLLAHASLSLRAAMVNTRQQKVLLASTQQQKETLDGLYNSMFDGKLKAIVDPKYVSNMLSMDDKGIDAIDLGQYNVGAIEELWQVIQNLLHEFFDKIGVRTHTDKKERLLSDEIISDTPMLNINVNNMLKCRQDMCKEVNEKWDGEFGTWSVKLNPDVYAVLDKNREESVDGEMSSENKRN